MTFTDCQLRVSCRSVVACAATRQQQPQHDRRAPTSLRDLVAVCCSREIWHDARPAWRQNSGCSWSRKFLFMNE